jgi:hypothetical protein
LDKVDTVLNKVENFMEFLTVNELEQELEKLQRNDFIKINEIGRSQNGYSIKSAKMGNGKNNALVLVFHIQMNL